MTALNLVWDPDREYRCFVDPAVGRASVVGSEIVDDARGHVLGDLVVVERGAVVCDLEIGNVSAGQLEDFVVPRVVSPVERLFDVVVDSEARARAAYAAGWLYVSFGATATDDATWWRLADSTLYFATSAGTLVAIAAEGPEQDPGGSREAQWIDNVSLRGRD
jgi:hypothetical protein